MPQRGKLLVISFFLVGFVLAAGAIWYHYAKTRWAMAYWGKENARLIVRASEVELFRITESPDLDEIPEAAEPPPSEPESPAPIWQLDGNALHVIEQRNITKTPGLIHMRMALVEDANFDIPAEPPSVRSWDYVFRFQGADHSVLIAVDSRQGLVRILDPAANSPTPIANIRPIAPGMRKFLSVQFAEAEEGDSD